MDEDRAMRLLIANNKVPGLPLELFQKDYEACGKVFSSLSKFYAHVRIHCNEKPFKCPIPLCGLSFNQKGNM